MFETTFPIRLGLLMACMLGLAGCADTALPPAGTEYDGSFVGQDSLVRGVAFQCGEPNLPERIEVRGGQFAYPFQVNPPRTAPLPVQVSVDGTLRGQLKYWVTEESPNFTRLIIDWAILNGRIAGATLDATITDLHCVRRLTARRE
jgi:hypothetical protein